MLSKSLLKLALSLGISSGAFALAELPASAAFLSLENPSIGGTSPTDFILRCSNSDVPAIPVGNVVPCPAGVTLGDVLEGGPGSPGGNVELHSVISPDFDFSEFTSLEGTIFGKDFFARSLTEDDWFANDNAFTRQFLNDALVANNFDQFFFDNFDTVVDTFIARGGPQRFSDPNITDVFVDDTDGTLTVGLAGVLNASGLLKQLFAGVVDPALIPNEVQVSEVVFVDYYEPGFLYSFSAANSGQSSNDLPFNPACPGGAPSGVNDPLANCSYSGDFRVSQIVGQTPTTPVMPGGTTPGGGFLFPNFPVFNTDQTIYFDPPIDNYEFKVESGPLFTSANLPSGFGSGAGNNFYNILLDDGGSCDNFVTAIGTAEAGIPFSFGGAVQCFAVTGVTSLESGDPFIVGLTFDSTGLVSFTKTPMPIPEPMTLLGAAVALGFGAQFKRKRSNSQD
jgi:hypothetical protein